MPGDVGPSFEPLADLGRLLVDRPANVRLAVCGRRRRRSAIVFLASRCAILTLSILGSIRLCLHSFALFLRRRLVTAGDREWVAIDVVARPRGPRDVCAVLSALRGRRLRQGGVEEAREIARRTYGQAGGRV